MKISAQLDYACRVLAELGRLHGSGAPARGEHLAEVEAVPPPFLAQILQKLRHGGLIVSRRGVQGGYALARPPGEISVLDILLAVEGQALQLSSKAEGRSGRRVRQVWRDLGTVIEERLRTTTLEQLVAREAAEMYYI
jgi:Rrf2 family protein